MPLFIKYVIPEDGDQLSHPNVFQLTNFSENSPPTVADIKKGFPIPGNYHYRFLKSIGNYTVWLDSEDDTNQIPSHQGSFFLKASRLPISVSFSEGIANNLSRHHSYNEPQEKPAEKVISSPTVKSIPKPPPKPLASVNLLDIGSDQVDNGQKNATNQSKVSADDKLLNFNDEFNHPSENVNVSHFKNNDLLDIDSSSTPSFSVNNKNSSRSSDLLFGLESLQPVSSVPPTPPVMMKTTTPVNNFNNPTMKSVGSTGNNLNSSGMGANSPMGGRGFNMNNNSNNNYPAAGNNVRGPAGVIPSVNKTYDPFNDLTGLSSSMRNNTGTSNKRN